MDVYTKKLVELTKEKFGLEKYFLKEYYYKRKVNIFNETIYLLCMEWFPLDSKAEDDLNPEGSACIELNLNKLTFEHVLFVMGQNLTDKGICFENFKEDAVKWIENETGYIFGEQFQLVKEDEDELTFASCCNEVRISPGGYIHISKDDEGKLISFSVDGPFPSKDIIKDEEFALSLEKLEHLSTNQIKLIELPIYEEKKLLPVYAFEEVFITNDGSKTIPFEDIEKNTLKINQIMYWDKPLYKPFIRKNIDWNEEITIEQVLSREPSPDSYPITDDEKEQCIDSIKTFLSQEYPNESGEWTLIQLNRENGYIIASLKSENQENFIFERKLKVFINPESFQVENFIDNQLMLETFENFQVSENIIISKEEAVSKLKDYFELTPYFVYDAALKHFILCGKLDCNYAVNALNGEVISLDEL